VRLAATILLFASSVWTWFHRLGGPGLMLLGILDNSVVPLPGSMDAVVILLSAHHRPWWPYYAFMATVGAVVGGFITYRLAEKGGEETLEKKIGKSRAEKVYRRFEKRGFVTIAVGSILPPPFPMVPLLLAAGVLQYPRKKFIFALTTGRGIRYFGIAYLGHLYGKAIISWLSQYYKPLLYTLIALGVLGGIAAFVYFRWYRPKRQREERERGQPVEQFPLPHRKNQKQQEQKRTGTER
jgi:membrane protein YqaA with SNARE-associated domain